MTIYWLTLTAAAEAFISLAQRIARGHLDEPKKHLPCGFPSVAL